MAVRKKLVTEGKLLRHNYQRTDLVNVDEHDRARLLDPQGECGHG